MPDQKTASAVTGADTEQRVYDLLVDGIIDKKLRPGTHLNEVQLAKSFDVARSRIRRVLERLETENVIKFERNRGAFVCLPTVKEALDVFEARRLLDSAIIKLVCERASDEDIDALYRHVALQDETLSRHLPNSARVGADFHMLLVHITGNDVLINMMTLLMRRLSLIQSLYENSSSVCLVEEHLELVRMIKDRDYTAAMVLANEHMLHVQKALDLSSPPVWPHY